jgi:hypothetical protein
VAALRATLQLGMDLSWSPGKQRVWTIEAQLEKSIQSKAEGSAQNIIQLLRKDQKGLDLDGSTGR